MERDLAALHHGADRNRELRAASVALETAGAVCLPLQARYTFIKGAAMRAFRTVRPDAAFKPLAREVVILKGRVVEIGRHCRTLQLIEQISELNAALSR